jgi:hypothetical protein
MTNTTIIEGEPATLDLNDSPDSTLAGAVPSHEWRQPKKGRNMMVGGLILLSFLTGLGVGIVGLIVVLISVTVVTLALVYQP